MWSIANMLAFVFLIVFGNLNLIQYANSAAPIQPVPQAPPVTGSLPTQNPGTGLPNQPGAPQPGNLWEASSRLATALGDTFQRIIQHKKNTLSSVIVSLGKAFNETSNQVGLKPDQTQTGVPATPTSPIAQPTQPSAIPPVSPPAQTTPPAQAVPSPGQTPPQPQPAPVTQP